jgi:predicted RNase H-like HicB family nuclease
MNFQAIASLKKMSLHVLVERVESGYFMASVPELADCVALAQTREEAICAERSSEAIAALQEKVRVRLCQGTRKHIAENLTPLLATPKYPTP